MEIMSQETREGKEEKLWNVRRRRALCSNCRCTCEPVVFSWIFSWGGEKVKILGPESVMEKVNAEIDRLVRQYPQK